MIVSHARKFVFVKTYKVGGTSLEIALSKYCGAADIIGPLEPDEEAFRREVFKTGPQNHFRAESGTGFADSVRRLAGRRRPIRFREHMPAWQIRREIGDDLWDSYFTFTIVRNPFDRCVSRFFHCAKYDVQNGAFDQWDHGSFDQFVRYKAEVINENWKSYTVKDAPIVDFCVRYEDMEADLAEVSRRIGLASNIYDEMRGIRMKGDIRPNKVHYRDVVQPQARDLISGICSEEIRLFGYSFDGPRTVGGDGDLRASAGREGADAEAVF